MGFKSPFATTYNVGAFGTRMISDTRLVHSESDEQPNSRLGYASKRTTEHPKQQEINRRPAILIRNGGLNHVRFDLVEAAGYYSAQRNSPHDNRDKPPKPRC